MGDLMSTKRREALIKAYEKQFGVIQKETFRQYIDIEPNIKKPKKKMSKEGIQCTLNILGVILLAGWIVCVVYFGPMVILITLAFCAYLLMISPP